MNFFLNLKHTLRSLKTLEGYYILNLRQTFEGVDRVSLKKLKGSKAPPGVNQTNKCYCYRCPKNSIIIKIDLHSFINKNGTQTHFSQCSTS